MTFTSAVSDERLLIGEVGSCSACFFTSGLLGVVLEISATTFGVEISAVTLDSGLGSRFFFQPKTGSHPQLG